MKKPNILIFNPDEMRADALAHLGNPAAITPNLDKIVSEDAVSFSHSYCQNPVCVPSRCSFFTGLYPHVRGHRTMEYLLHPGEETLFSELKRAGYYVWMNDRNDLLAGQIKGWAESHADEIFYSGAMGASSKLENPDIKGVPGEKNYYSHFKGKILPDENGKTMNGDDYIVDAAIDRILNPVSDQPFCMFLGLNYPHVPYTVEEPYYSAIDRRKLPKRIQFGSCKNKAQMIDDLHRHVNMENYTEEDWDELRAVYLGMCMKVDHQFGKIVEALKQTGEYDNTAIFVLSDHGDFAGDYGLVEKSQNTFEDCLTHVPLIIKPPKGTQMQPGIADGLVELVDFYATALDFASVPSSHTNFGKSLRPMLADHTVKLREYVYAEGGRTVQEPHCDEYHFYGKGKGPAMSLDYWPKMISQTDPISHAKGVMMRGERYKYVSRVAGSDELYDLQDDPQETINRIDDPALRDVLIDMKSTMLKWLEYSSDIVPLEYDSRWTNESVWNKVKNSVIPGREELVRKLIEDGMDLFALMEIAAGKKD